MSELEQCWGRMLVASEPVSLRRGKPLAKAEAVREAYWKVGKGIDDLKGAGLKVSNDPKLKKAVTDLEHAFDALYGALKPYDWDD